MIKKNIPRTAYKKGHTTSKEIRDKISNAQKGNKYRVGTIHTEETKHKLSLKRKGKTWEEIFGKDNAKRMKKERSLQRGNYKHSEETKNKIRKAVTGQKNGNWFGGIMHTPYGFDCTTAFKKSIRERDNYTCLLCKKEGRCTHHIDYNKNNNDPKNLITLCRKCHGKTGNNREYWINKILQEINRR